MALFGGSRLFSKAARSADSERLGLFPGDRVAVVGGGPAGSFFAYFLQRIAARVDLDLHVDIYEPRRFRLVGPAGCNHCGGIVSESLVQILAAEGIVLPDEVIQRGIDSYVVHMDVGSVRIESRRDESSIAALYRGSGPRGETDVPWESFDGHLLRLAMEKGAHVIPRMVTGIGWDDDLPLIETSEGATRPYHLVAVATGVNSRLVELVDRRGTVKGTPKTTRTYICELRSDPKEIERYLGTSMHVFLLDIPRLEFAALIPKGEFVTVCLLGEDVDDALIESFLAAPEVRRCFPTDQAPRVCNCSPVINVSGVPRPFADRVVFVGDAGVTRLYKDGVGAAFRTAKGAAETAVLYGVSVRDFERHYRNVCRSIEGDNRVGKFLFAMSHLVKTLRFARRGVIRMTELEQQGGNGKRPMSEILWNLFTGSAPYREILRDAVNPGFVTGLAWNLVKGNMNGRESTAAREEGVP